MAGRDVGDPARALRLDDDLIERLCFGCERGREAPHFTRLKLYDKAMRGLTYERDLHLMERGRLGLSM